MIKPRNLHTSPTLHLLQVVVSTLDDDDLQRQTRNTESPVSSKTMGDHVLVNGSQLFIRFGMVLIESVGLCWLYIHNNNKQNYVSISINKEYSPHKFNHNIHFEILHF